MRLLIVIPAYNEAENIVSVVEELKTVVPQYDYVIVNDDLDNAVKKLRAVLLAEHQKFEHSTVYANLISEDDVI